jgi:hypothetical protein
MNKVIDFYQKADNDEKLKADLEAANKRFEGRKNAGQETLIAEVIRIAGDHGYSLEAADFAVRKEVDEKELEAVAGGGMMRPPTDPDLIRRVCNVVAKRQVDGIFV